MPDILSLIIIIFKSLQNIEFKGIQAYSFNMLITIIATKWFRQTSIVD